MKLTRLLLATVTIGLCCAAGPFARSSAKNQVQSSKRLSAGCGCNDLTSIRNRLGGVDAVLTRLASESQGTAARRAFDAAAFDEGLGESIMQIMGETGGMGSMVIGDIDRSSCEIETGQSMSNIPGLPAGMAGSSCLTEGLTVGLNLRRKACLSGRNSSNEGNDYWEGRQMSDVIRELTEAYTAEAKFLRDQQNKLGPTCKKASGKPSEDLCENCIHYMFDASRTLPVVGTIRMWADEVIPFEVKPDRTVSGWGHIDTILDTSGSPCKFSGYNGAADFDITGRIATGNLHLTLTPRGTSQTISASMSVSCPPKGEAHSYPQSQTYTVNEILKVPAPGQVTEKRLDVGTLTSGAMDGEIILRLSMKLPR